MSELLEISDTLERLNGDLQDLMIRGLRVCGPEHLNALKSIQEHLAGVGAKYLADRLQILVTAIEADSPTAAAELMETQAAMRVFERVLTLGFADAALTDLVAVTAHHSDGDTVESEGDE
jgi:hypothetical protein